MSQKKGLYIVLEGIDGSGTTTQLTRVVEAFLNENKYQDIALTHEPWKNEEIKRRLIGDKDAYSGAEEMTELYINDGIKHSEAIRIWLNEGLLVISDRARLSTPAYQCAQGMKLERIMQMHRDRSIVVPDITFLLDLPVEVAFVRMGRRIQTEKFERRDFLEEVRKNYLELARLSIQDTYLGEDFRRLFGPIEIINGNQDFALVTKDIIDIAAPIDDKYLVESLEEKPKP